MRAKELYKDREWSNEDLGAYILELDADSKALIDKRHIQTDSALAAIIAEINGKHNALMRIFQRNQGSQPLINDLFVVRWLEKMPELAEYFPNVKPIEELRSDAADSVVGIPEEAIFCYYVPLVVNPAAGVELTQGWVVINSKTGYLQSHWEKAIQAMEAAAELSGLPRFALMPYFVANRIYTMFEGKSCYASDSPFEYQVCCLGCDEKTAWWDTADNARLAWNLQQARMEDDHEQ